MRLVRTLVVISLATVVLALAAAPAGAQSAPETPTLVDVRAGGHTGYDRVVFEFRGPVPEHRIGYVDQLVEDGSGNPVSVAGAADLEVVFEGANAHEEDGSPTVSPRRFSPGLTAVKEVAQVGDFEAMVSYGIGLDQRRPIEVSTLSSPSRLVIDVPTTARGRLEPAPATTPAPCPSPARRAPSCWSPGSPCWPPGRPCWPWPAAPGPRKASPGDRGPPATTRGSRSATRAAASRCSRTNRPKAVQTCPGSGIASPPDDRPTPPRGPPRRAPPPGPRPGLPRTARAAGRGAHPQLARHHPPRGRRLRGLRGAGRGRAGRPGPAGHPVLRRPPGRPGQRAGRRRPGGPPRRAAHRVPARLVGPSHRAARRPRGGGGRPERHAVLRRPVVPAARWWSSSTTSTGSSGGWSCRPSRHGSAGGSSPGSPPASTGAPATSPSPRRPGGSWPASASPPAAVTVVHNGMATPGLAGAIPRTPFPSVCVLGRLVPHKRVELALEAAARIRPHLPELKVLVVGQGYWEPRLREAVERLGLQDAVELLGWVDEATKQRVLASSWALAMPSVKEGWGLAVLEAAASGTPTVAFRAAGGLRESVLHGTTGPARRRPRRVHPPPGLGPAQPAPAGAARRGRPGPRRPLHLAPGGGRVRGRAGRGRCGGGPARGRQAPAGEEPATGRATA